MCVICCGGLIAFLLFDVNGTSIYMYHKASMYQMSAVNPRASTPRVSLALALGLPRGALRELPGSDGKVAAARWVQGERKTETAPTGGQVPSYIIHIEM